MDDIIKGLLGVEDEAKKILDEAETSDRAFASRLNAKKAEVEKRLAKETEDAVKAAAAAADEETKRKLKEIKAASEKRKKALHEEYNANKDKWRRDIVKFVTGVGETA